MTQRRVHLVAQFPGNNVSDGVMMLSLMRLVDISSCGVEPDLGFEEGEHHQFDYAIIPFAGEAELDTLALARAGMEFVVRPYVYAAGDSHEGKESPRQLRSSMGLLRVGAANINCTAMYPSGDRVGVRLHEAEGRAAEAVLHVAFPVESVEETHALLQDGRTLSCCEGAIRLSFKPFEIKTLVVNPRSR